jgi:hypothetical protein
MKKRITTFSLSFLIYGIVAFLITYYSEPEKHLSNAIKYAVFFGAAMGIFDAFVQPRIRKYFAERNKNNYF